MIPPLLRVNLPNALFVSNTSTHIFLFDLRVTIAFDSFSINLGFNFVVLLLEVDSKIDEIMQGSAN